LEKIREVPFISKEFQPGKSQNSYRGLSFKFQVELTMPVIFAVTSLLMGNELWRTIPFHISKLKYKNGSNRATKLQPANWRRPNCFIATKRGIPTEKTIALNL